MLHYLLAPATAIACLMVSAQAESLDVAGLWLTPSGNSTVELYDCGDATPCGKVAWIAPDKIGRGIDINNPDEALRTRSLIGLVVLNNFKRRKNDWRNGKIYDPENGKTYGARLKLLEDGTLKVNGCIGPLCQTQIWPATAPVE